MITMQLGMVMRPVYKVYKWGGRREGAGRKRSKPAGGVTHAVRPFHERREPVHVTLKVVQGLPSLRSLGAARVVGQTIRAVTARNAQRGTGFRICHFSIQSDHLHLIVEAGSKTTLARGMAGLAIAIARRLNAVFKRRGKLFAERYHAQPLTTPKQVRNTIVYVLQNHLRHRPDRYLVDSFSSGPWFTGWEAPLPIPPTPPPVAAPMTWLLNTGWRRHGRIRFAEGPA